MSFLRHLKIICSNGIVFKNFRGTVDNLIIQLVSNYYVDDKVWPEVKRDILQEIGNSVPRGIKTEIRLDTTFGILSEIIKLEKSCTQGRRYGHPVLDIARELNRYLHPNIKSAGRKKAEIETIKEKFRKIFMELLK